MTEPPLSDVDPARCTAIVGHIVRHDYYLIDVDGQPTLWGHWNPEYVNWYPHTIVIAG